MDYNNSSRRFRPWGSRVMALSIKCDSLALRTESREEWIFSSGINCMSVCEWLEWERKCSVVMGLVLSTARLCSLNLSLRSRLVSPICCKLQQLHQLNHVDHVSSVTSILWSDAACFTHRVKSITCKAISNVSTSGTILSTAEGAWQKKIVRETEKWPRIGSELTDKALKGFLAENQKSNDGSLSTAQLNHVIGEGKKAADKAWSDDWTLLLSRQASNVSNLNEFKP